MAGEVIDLVSSSPVPARHADPPSSFPFSSLPLPPPSYQPAPKPTLPDLLSDTWLYSSDASETVEILEKSRANKRPRLITTRQSQTGVVQPAAGSIDLTSPQRTSPPPTQLDTLPESSVESELTRVARAADVQEDPFASSPLPVLRNVAPSLTSRLHRPVRKLPPPENISSDPFASSPIAGPSKPPTRAPAPKTTSLQADTRPIATWDPISSSIPDSPAPLIPALTKQISEPVRRPSIVSIHDSSSQSEDDDLPDIAQFDLSQPIVQTYNHTYSKPSTSTSKAKPRAAISRSQSETQGRSANKEATAAAKAAEKERKRREREENKENRRLEKVQAAAIAEVNKAKTDRKISAMEMIVELPSTLPESVRLQAETFLENIGVQYCSREHDVPNIVRWKRKVNSRFDDDSGQWVPAPARVEDEQHILKILTADELVSLAVADELSHDAEQLKHKFAGQQIIYILEGVESWMRKNRNLRNRQFTSNVRGEAAPQRRRNNQPTPEYVDEEVIKDAMLSLQVEHDMLMHHTSSPLETAQWIATATEHISTIPYKKKRDETTSTARFCMDSGQVKTGEDTRDTYVRMLQEIFRVTAPIAYSVVSEFGSISELVKGLASEGPKRLENVKKSANKDGALSDRVIGPAVSRRLHKIFTGTDELSTDV